MDYLAILETLSSIIISLKNYMFTSMSAMNISIFIILLLIIFIYFVKRTIKIYMRAIMVGIISALFALLINSYMNYGWTGMELLRSMLTFSILGIFIYLSYEKMVLIYDITKVIYIIIKFPLKFCQYLGDFVLSSVTMLVTRPAKLLSKKKKRSKHRYINIEEKEEPQKRHIDKT
ncbi:MAG: hypothetical protein KAJ54_01405 [Candidatus Aenigmarchaeota archaeon]|nr:hypothetical protein [Candidatus Aenigmarchaeota archaeon]MCK5321764.1 hypothetical protein [Candidatus Aenigmarchaeota archaeon]